MLFSSERFQIETKTNTLSFYFHIEAEAENKFNGGIKLYFHITK